MMLDRLRSQCRQKAISSENFDKPVGTYIINCYYVYVILLILNLMAASGDPKKMGILDELFCVSFEQRDENWNQKFLANVDEAGFKCDASSVTMGPDGFTYFALYLGKIGAAQTGSFEGAGNFVIKEMKNDLLLKGHGLAIFLEGGASARQGESAGLVGPGQAANLAGGVPQWVFSYGDLLCYYLTGQFYSAEPPMEIQPLEGDQGGYLLAQPAENFLPAASRRVISDFLGRFKILEPKILLMIRNIAKGPLQQLVFNLSTEMFESAEQYQDVMGRLGWFLPRHYQYAALPKGQGFDDSFMPL